MKGKGKSRGVGDVASQPDDEPKRVHREAERVAVCRQDTVRKISVWTNRVNDEAYRPQNLLPVWEEIPSNFLVLDRRIPQALDA